MSSKIILLDAIIEDVSTAQNNLFGLEYSTLTKYSFLIAFFVAIEEHRSLRQLLTEYLKTKIYPFFISPFKPKVRHSPRQTATIRSA